MEKIEIVADEKKAKIVFAGIEKIARDGSYVLMQCGDKITVSF